MKVLASYGGNYLQYINASDQHVVHFKLTHYVNYTSVKREKNKWHKGKLEKFYSATITGPETQD